MSHLPDTWWGSSNMRDNCSSLTIALCLLLLFPFSLLPFPLLVSRQKIERKKIATDRNLSYYTAECPKHETENSSLCLLIYLFILYLPFFPLISALRFVTATAGQSRILPPPPPPLFWSFFFFCNLFFPLTLSFSSVLWASRHVLTSFWFGRQTSLRLFGEESGELRKPKTG